MSARLILARLRAARARGGDAGITLTELIVSMGLTSLIGALTLGLFLGINTSTTATTDRSINTSSARSAIQAWTAYLRVADGTIPGVKTNRFEWLTAKDVLFYSDLANRNIDTVATTAPPTMMWLRLDAAGSLVEEQFPSTASYGAAPTVCRTLVTSVTTPAAPLFTGFDASGGDMSNRQLGTAPAASTGCRPLPVTPASQTKQVNLVAQANLQNVSSVRIDFVVRDTTNGHPVEFTSQAVLPALGGV